MADGGDFDSLRSDAVHNAITLEDLFTDLAVAVLRNYAAHFGIGRDSASHLHDPFGKDSRIAGRIRGNIFDEFLHLSGSSRGPPYRESHLDSRLSTSS